MTDEELLKGIEEMIEEAPSVGLCTLPFKIIRDGFAAVIAERNELKSYREPQTVEPYTGHIVDGVGRCPRCGVVFLDSSTPFCGNCGQKLEWSSEDGSY